MMDPGGKSAAGYPLTNLRYAKMDDITKGLQSAIIVVENYQRWRKGKIESITYSPTEISMALEVVIESAKVLLIMEQIKNQQAKEK